jgi:hypothetical protein
VDSRGVLGVLRKSGASPIAVTVDGLERPYAERVARAVGTETHTMPPAKPDWRRGLKRAVFLKDGLDCHHGLVDLHILRQSSSSKNPALPASNAPCFERRQQRLAELKTANWHYLETSNAVRRFFDNDHFKAAVERETDAQGLERLLIICAYMDAAEEWRKNLAVPGE